MTMTEDKIPESTAGDPEQIDTTATKISKRRNPFEVLLNSARHVRGIVADARQQVYGADRKAEAERRERETAEALNASQEQRRINITRETAVTLGLAAPFLWAGVSWGESFLGKTDLGNALMIGSWAELSATAAAIGLGAAAPKIEDIRGKIKKYREERIATKKADSKGNSTEKSAVPEAPPAEENE
jgi:hypothetical protein